MILKTLNTVALLKLNRPDWQSKCELVYLTHFTTSILHPCLNGIILGGPVTAAYINFGLNVLSPLNQRKKEGKIFLTQRKKTKWRQDTHQTNNHK